MAQLLASGIHFKSKIDEKMFFSWLSKISAVSDQQAMGSTIIIEMKSNRIPDDDLRELIGLFDRYQIEMKQLSQFLSEENKRWFQVDHTAYWYKKVFP